MPDSDETGPRTGGALDTMSDDAPVRRSLHLERGTSMGRYVVLEPVGRGGMSIVYAAYDPELDRKVALKVLRGSADVDSPMRARERMRLLREAQAMARLTHPNVMPIYDAGSFGERVFLAMHFVEGQTLTQWLSTPHDWREIVEFFVYAGRGLEAAHAAGLVHRDFKPDNVLVDRESRVRVTDFGLARPSAATRSMGDDDPASTGTAAVSSTRLAQPVTMAGSVLGTPAYMSAEQHLALEVDARTDQFSFCVALWEALVGERPFAGTTVGELAFAVTHGAKRAFPRESPVPARIRRALERGLAREPADRFESMAPLLDALAPTIRRRPLLMLGAAAALVGVGAMIPMLGDAEAQTDPCAAARAGLGELYDGPVRDGIVQAAIATGGLSATGTEGLASALDRNAASWRDAAVAACVEHRIDGVQSAEAFDARMSCLDRRRAEFEDLLARLRGADEAHIVAIASAVFDAVDPAQCDDVDRLLQTVPPPDDPALRAQAAEVADALDDMFGDVRSDDAALAQATSLLARAEATGWHSLVARAHAALAHVHEARGEIANAEAAFRAAARAAATGHDDARLVVVLGELAYALVYLQGRAPEALEIAYLIELELARSDGAELRPATYTALGNIYQGTEQFDRARDAYLQALALMDAGVHDNPIRRAVALNNLGTIALAQGDAIRARSHFEQALELAIATHGEDYVRLSDNYVNLCESYIVRGELDAARPRCARALALVDGPRPRDVAAAARALLATALLEELVGDFDAARRALDRGRPLITASYGEGSIGEIAVDLIDARLKLDRGELDGAKRQAMGIDALAAGGGVALAHGRAEAQVILGAIAQARGDHARAAAACDAAIETLAANVTANPMAQQPPLTCRGSALGRLGRIDEARADLQEVIASHGRFGGDPYLQARARYELARLLTADADLPQARALALAAREDLRPIARRDPALVTEIDAWLEAHP